MARTQPGEPSGEPVTTMEETPAARRRRELQDARRSEALSLRLAGLSIDQIAGRMELSYTGVRELIGRALDRYAGAATAEIEEQRALETARLDRLQAAVWPSALKGDLKAVETARRLIEQRARMNGLNMPVQLDLSVTVRQEMETALRGLERLVLGEVLDG